MMKASFALWLLLILSTPCFAATEAKLFQGKERQRLDLRNYKRGLFFGSCGPATRSLQWEYSFELKGVGTLFEAPSIEIKDSSLTTVPVSSGTITVDEKHRSISVHLRTRAGGVEQEFPHNGEYRFTRPK